MNPGNSLSRCLTFINCQLQTPSTATSGGIRETSRLVITISRQAGSGAHAVAEWLAEYLQAKYPVEGRPYTVFDRNLVEKVLEDHKLPGRVARFMPEDRISEISDTMDELFGLHPSSWTLVHKTAETILHLAELGNVILIGRGANIITNKLPYAFHVRLVGSVEKRLAHLQDYYKLDYKTAQALVREGDLGRKRFLKKYFEKEIDDPLLYHMVVNTDLLSHAEVARIIAEAAIRTTPVAPMSPSSPAVMV